MRQRHEDLVIDTDTDTPVAEFAARRRGQPAATMAARLNKQAGRLRFILESIASYRSRHPAWSKAA